MSANQVTSELMASSSHSGEAKHAGTLTIVRASFCHLVSNPLGTPDDSDALESYDDGGLVFDSSGRILELGEFKQVLSDYRQARVVDHSGSIAIPGFVDCHIHLPQALMIGAFGEELLDWLTRHTRPEETKYKDPAYALNACKIFFEQEISHGTTTAVIFGPHFREAIEIAFAEAERRNFRAILGLTMEDRDLPAELAMLPETAYALSKRLIEKWHERGKLRYIVTPRFALTCSPEMLAVCKRLLSEFPSVYFQTHLNENHREIERISDVFPNAKNYLDVYNQFELLGPRSFFHHSIYSSDSEIDLLASTDSRIVHCPSSNMFLGSGLFPLKKYLNKGLKIALGTDVGGGTGFGMLKEMGTAYNIQSILMFAMNSPDLAIKLTGIKLLYLATLAGAQALGLQEEIGSFRPGRKADLVLIDPRLDSYLDVRLKNTSSPSERLFLLAVLANKQAIKEVLIDGKTAYRFDQKENLRHWAESASILGQH